MEAAVSDIGWQAMDLDLARRLASDTSGALDEVVQTHGAHLRRLLGSLSGWSDDLDDLMQETLLKAWTNAKTYRGEAPLQHWLTRIAVGVCRNHQRSSRRWFKHLRSYWSQQTPDSAIAKEDPRVDEMQQAMNRLSHSDRELLVLFHIEQQSPDVMATVLSVKIETLHVRLHRARTRLRDLLKQSGEI